MLTEITKILGRVFDELYSPGAGTQTVIYRDTCPEDFEKISVLIKNSGYKTVFERSFYGNLCATFTGDKVYHLVYSRDAELRLTEDKNTVLPDLTNETAPLGGNSKLWLFETNHIYIDCGMCMIVKLCDGSFFIIDSAHYLSVGDYERIHTFLKKNSDSGKIIISGWYFSHSHTDHISQFMYFLKREYDDVEIQGLYYNFIGDSHPDINCWEEYENIVRRDFQKLVALYDIPKYTLHFGQRFRIANLTASVICTHEQVYPMSMSDFNDTSTALMLEIEGNKILIPGDCSRKSSVVMEKLLAEYLKCDIVQVSHHGHTGTTENFYRLADARVALFANTQIKHDEEYPRRPENRFAIAKSERFFVSSNGTVEIPLPYLKENVFVHPDETIENFNAIFGLWGYDYTDDFKKNIINSFLQRGGNQSAIKTDKTENIYISPFEYKF